MAELKSVIVPLNGSHYATWKVQRCRMALMKGDVWGLVDGTESAPDESDQGKYNKYVVRRNRALAMIILSVEPKLSCFIC